jgi:hypothetical protein
MRTSHVIKGILMAAAAAAPMLCNAESNIQTTSGQTATAHVDLQITVPKFLFLRVGTGSNYTTGVYTGNPQVDLITWTLTTANVGTGALTGTGGDILPAGTETAALICNSGNAVTFTSQTAGFLTDTTADTISYSNITVAAAALTGTYTLLNPPALADGATTTTTVNGAGHVVKADAKWTFSYANNPVPAGGVYGGGGPANTGNGRVTYTATMP